MLMGNLIMSEIRLLDAGMVELLTVALPETGDNGVAVVDLGSTSGVVYMMVDLNGSGAIDEVCFEKDVVSMGCTRTIGYWKNHMSVMGPLLPVWLGDAGWCK